jgi:hypothetical protein
MSWPKMTKHNTSMQRQVQVAIVCLYTRVTATCDDQINFCSELLITDFCEVGKTSGPLWGRRRRRGSSSPSLSRRRRPPR